MSYEAKEDKKKIPNANTSCAPHLDITYSEVTI